MRIVGGEWGGRILVSPPGEVTRPTSDSAREALFNILEHGLGHASTNIIDVFAGTGAIAFEALSRGAERAVLIESDPKALKAIQKNTDAFGASERVGVITAFQWEKWSALIKKNFHECLPFSTAFCDPPYDKGLVSRAMKALEKDGFWAPDAMLVAETSSREEVPKLQGWEFIKERRKGPAALLFYKRA
jgi:16S rRNA (guanine966-N2)-methyltransferase